MLKKSEWKFTGRKARSQKRSPSKALLMQELDVQLLKEYGFKRVGMSSPRLNRKKIDGMNMRQLDRIKMLLLRNLHLCGKYSESLNVGILRNDLDAFSKAISLLSNFIER